ncbi:hypothetical protein PLICRDRAFT_50360 [Plicaturopsis crispa FD-325 SS-3]|nr:hypothetical protein PLICRDRAFT_50360 [Plicaturopsis crispa FD-325 SS-3]
MFGSSNNVAHSNEHLRQNGHANGNANGNSTQPPPPQPPHHTQSARPAPQTASKETINVVGTPSVSIQNNRLVVGDARSSSARSYTPLKVLGDGSFGTVWLCDWHGTLPPNTPLSPMQCGGGARPEWVGKRLVAVKRMKKRWEGGWDECKKLKELESLRAIPFHPNIIPLYDFFLLPGSKELYFVFESMEGNLYHLIKARKGRALAGGLVSSIFRQIVTGLHHIHASGYFHRDMKPENVLVTTTGLYDYQPVSPTAPPNAPPEKDVVAIIKLADFGLARETKSKPPYTEYVSTRWYRAPEVLLLARDYSNPVDMWALGTIMAELVNLRPLFPGEDQIRQILRICDVLGDPSDEYGYDQRGKAIGGGKWSKGIKMAKTVGFAFKKTRPVNFQKLFDQSVPHKLVECISDLLKYDPETRLTSKQCLEHPYLLETTPRNLGVLSIPTPPPTAPSKPPNGVSLPIAAPRSVPPSHSYQSGQKHHIPPTHIPSASASHRAGFYPSPVHTSTTSASHRTAEYVNELRTYEQPPDIIQEEERGQDADDATWSSPGAPRNGWDMDISPQHEAPPYTLSDQGHGMNIPSSPMAQEYPARPQPPKHIVSDISESPHTHSSAKPKLNVLKKNTKHSKWDISRMFGGGDKQLPTLAEVPGMAPGGNSRKRSQSSSTTDSQSLSELSPSSDQQQRFKDPKTIKKEAERVQREAEKQRRALAEKMHREQARAVMEKRNQMVMENTNATQLEWKWQHSASLVGTTGAQRQEQSKGKRAATGPIRQPSSKSASATVSAASGRFGGKDGSSSDWRSDSERYPKARRREFDDDHSMSSSDVHSIGPVSNISFATVDSDPGPTRMRHRASLFGINRMTSTSSLRTSFDDFPQSVRSSNSLSLEQQFVNDFNTRANLDPALSGSVSPPPMQTLSLSSNSPTWMPQGGKDGLSRGQVPNFIQLPSAVPQHPSNMDPSGPHSPFEFTSITYPPSPGLAPKSAINPIFKVPPLPSSTGDRLSSPIQTLPPFSQLQAVAEGEYPPLSPMSFHTPDDA